MLIIQNGYKCDYEMKLFYKLYFDMNEDISVETNEQYKHLVGQNGMPIYILTEFSPISSSKIFSFFATLYARSIFSSDTS